MFVFLVITFVNFLLKSFHPIPYSDLIRLTPNLANCHVHARKSGSLACNFRARNSQYELCNSLSRNFELFGLYFSHTLRQSGCLLSLVCVGSCFL